MTRIFIDAGVTMTIYTIYKARVAVVIAGDVRRCRCCVLYLWMLLFVVVV